jgi:hypothetical protein
MKLRHSIIFVGIFLAFANPASAQITPSKESLSNIYPGKAYSPYAERNFPDQVAYRAVSRRRSVWSTPRPG